MAKRGFTLVELSLSIAFLAILSITIVLIITNAISSYHRGMTLNDVNSVGMDLIDDFRGAIQNSSRIPVADLCTNAYSNNMEGQELCKANNASRLTSIVRYGKVKVGNAPESDNVPLFGAFCTGRYSYIWNSGYYFAPDSNVEIGDGISAATFSWGESGNYDGPIKLLKIRDTSRAVCAEAVKNASQGSYGDGNISSEFQITNTQEVTSEPPVDLLEANNNLAIYDLVVPAPADNGNNVLFYSVSFILGTVQGGINVMASGDYCATPGGFNAAVENFDYCAINKFNFAAQATGG